MRRLSYWLSKPVLLTVLVVAIIACISLISGLILQKEAEKVLHEEIRQQVQRVASVSTLLIDTERHLQWKPEDANTPEYQKAVAPLLKVLKASPDIHDIYTFVLRDGKVYFVLGTPEYLGENRTPDYSYLHNPYDEATLEMLYVLQQGVSTADKQFSTDQWGTFLSGYAPLHTADGRLVGAVGVDLHVEEYRERMQALRTHAFVVYATVVLISMLIGSAVYLLAKRVEQHHLNQQRLACELQAALEKA